MVNVQEKYVSEILTKSKLPDADYVVNPYIGCPHKCIYCYAEFMKRFTNHVGDVWGDFIDVKVFSNKVSSQKLKNRCVLISSVTDPYNYFEAKYGSTRRVLENLVNTETRVEILTKSSLVLKDLDLIKKFKNIRIGISLNTLDESFRKKIEPRASSIQNRLQALKTLKNENISTYLFISPMFPEITDYKSILQATRDYVDCYYFENLNLRAGYKTKVLTLIKNYYPHLVALYDKIFCQSKHIYWENLKNDIENDLRKSEKEYKIYFYHDEIKKK